MDLGIKGKKAIVTGGGRGLGRSIASSLANEGVAIAIVSRTAADIDSFLCDHGSDHLGLKYDLLEEDSPLLMVKELKDRDWYPDIIVNNVGGNLGYTDPLGSISEWRMWSS